MDEMDSSEDKLRLIALDRAIVSKSGIVYDNYGKSIIDHNRIIEAAKVFEAYLKGE